MPVYSLTIRNRAVAMLIALVVLGAGAALLVVGLALLAAIAVAGGVLGAGILAYRKLRGQPTLPMRSAPLDAMDPSLEVFPVEAATGEVRSVGEPNEEHPRLSGE